MRTAFVICVLVLSTVVWMSGCSGVRRPVEGEKVVDHTVARGETLEEIAAEYYGDRGRAGEIAKFNRLDADRVRSGQTLRIPLTPDEQAALTRRQSARGPYNEGLAQVEGGRYLDAVLSFQRAIELDPAFGAAHYNLGVTFQRLESYDKAESAYRDAVRCDPGDANYKYALGATCYHQGDYTHAIDWFRRALEIDDRHRNAQYSLAKAYEKTAQPSRARAAWIRYLEIDGDSAWADEARSRLEQLE
jgi:tetratricopeptide (TPR) repeat protein